jgi:membrane protein implicated in regulation of membrane protease activity
MNGQVKLTTIGVLLLAILVLSLIAVFLGSSTLQAIGFVVALIVIIVLIADRLPRMRVGGGHDLGLDSAHLRPRQPGQRPPLDERDRP